MTKEVPVAVFLHDLWKDSETQFWSDHLTKILDYSLVEAMAIIEEYRQFHARTSVSDYC